MVLELAHDSSVVPGTQQTKGKHINVVTNETDGAVAEQPLNTARVSRIQWIVAAEVVTDSGPVCIIVHDWSIRWVPNSCEIKHPRIVSTMAFDCG